jgi:hypothetical protein
MRVSLRSSLLLSATLALAACETNPPPPTSAASLSIVAPADHAMIELPADRQLAIDFNTSYTLQAPGMCASQANCGHVYVFIDGDSCDVPGLPYNRLASASPAVADLSKCGMPIGAHTITLGLRNDDGSQVQDQFGDSVTSQIALTIL